jgi:hypothetical protein
MDNRYTRKGSLGGGTILTPFRNIVNTKTRITVEQKHNMKAIYDV